MAAAAFGLPCRVTEMDFLRAVALPETAPVQEFQLVLEGPAPKRAAHIALGSTVGQWARRAGDRRSGS